jgi:two-component system C4-dicarboxylate transport response regulator DctD
LETKDLAKPRVLVVDDDPLTCAFLTQFLESQAFEVISTRDAGEALGQVRSDAPEVVILDLRLPGLGGMEALRELKEIAPQVPIIILTGYGDVSSAVEAMRRGAYDFLTKPIQSEKIVGVVRRALERYALGMEVKALKQRLGQRDAEKRSSTSSSRSGKWPTPTSPFSSRERPAPGKNWWLARSIN